MFSLFNPVSFDNIDVLIASAGEVDNDNCFCGQYILLAVNPGEGVGAFQRRQNAFTLCKDIKNIEHVPVFNREILGSFSVFEQTVFRPYAGIIQACRDRFGIEYLAVFVLHKIHFSAVEDADFSGVKRGGVSACFKAFAGRLNADEFDIFIIYKRTKNSDGVASAADAGGNDVWQAADFFKALRTRLYSDAGLKMFYNGRIWMRAAGGAEKIKRVSNI
jgi:hypothetical protein